MLDLGTEQDICHDGEIYHLGRVTLAVLEAWRDWVRRQVGDPFAVADRYVDKLAPADAVALVREGKAVKDALDGLDIGSPLFVEWLGKARGSAKMLHLMLLGSHPDATEGLAFDIALRMGMESAARVVRTAAGGEGGNAAAPAPAA